MAVETSSEIIGMAQSFKDELIAGNDDAINRLILSYSKAYLSLQEQWKSITDRIVRARLSERDFSPSWIFRQQKYSDLMQQLEEQINAVAKGAAKITQDQQLQAWIQGQAHTSDLVLAQSNVTWSTLPHEAAKNIIGFMGDGSPLSYKFADMAPKVASGIKQALTNSVIQGWSAAKTLKVIEGVNAEALTNAMTVVRTETMRAYRESAFQSMQQNARVVQGWIWVASLSSRTCAACWGMHGTFHDIDERMSDHVNGRCTQVPVVKGYSIAVANPEERFAGLSQADQKAILGPGKYTAWRSDKIKLRDIPEVTKSKIWGNSVRIKSNSQLGIQSAPLKIAVKPWQTRLQGLTDNEKNAIKWYTGSAYQELNKSLREGLDLTSLQKGMVKSLDSGLAKLPPFGDATYRTLLFSSEEAKQAFLDVHKEGEVVGYAEYISTAKSGIFGWNSPHASMVRITVHGKSGKDISTMSEYPEEREVLFQREKIFDVFKVEHLENGCVDIILKELE